MDEGDKNRKGNELSFLKCIIALRLLCSLSVKSNWFWYFSLQAEERTKLWSFWKMMTVNCGGDHRAGVTHGWPAAMVKREGRQQSPCVEKVHLQTCPSPQDMNAEKGSPGQQGLLMGSLLITALCCPVKANWITTSSGILPATSTSRAWKGIRKGSRAIIT